LRARVSSTRRGGATQQVTPDEPLQGADLAAECTLRLVEPGGSPVEVEFVGHDDECPQVAQLDHVGDRWLGQDLVPG
jgi:hypothetical protein